MGTRYSWIWLSVAGAVAFTAAAFWFGSRVIAELEGSAGLAAWVQAIGSILAIFAAIGVFLAQDAQVKRARRVEREDFMLLALGIAGAAGDLATDAQRLSRRISGGSRNNA